ncbi:MAG: winged helix-turn-helix domain-containing protein [Cyanobacteria bacterium SBLK]|nr:winged helix-turn-helix domain-containing protein [Cyanobacteria bacterium SBLK]
MPAMEFSPEHWKSHDRGKKTRLRLLEYLDDHPKASISEIATNLGRSRRQVERQISRLKEEGILRYDQKWSISRNNSFFIPKFLRRIMAFLGRPARRRPRWQRDSPMQLHFDRSTAEAAYFTLNATDWMELSLTLNFPEPKSPKQISQQEEDEREQENSGRFIKLTTSHVCYLKKRSLRFQALCEEMEKISQGKTIYIAKAVRTKASQKTENEFDP